MTYAFFVLFGYFRMTMIWHLLFKLDQHRLHCIESTCCVLYLFPTLLVVPLQQLLREGEVHPVVRRDAADYQMR